jgi:hypothetical protein
MRIKTHLTVGLLAAGLIFIAPGAYLYRPEEEVVD